MWRVFKDIGNFWGKEKVIVFILFFFFSGIMYRLGFYMALLLLPLMLMKKHIGKYLDCSFFLLLVFSTFYAFLTSVNGYNTEAKANIIFLFLYPPLFYFIGRWMTDRYYRFIYAILFLLIVSVALPTFYDILKDIQTNHFINISREIEHDKGEARAATLLGVNVSLCICSIGLILVRVRNRLQRSYKYLLIGMGILGCISVIHLLNRTGLALMMIAVFLIGLKMLRQLSVKKIILVSVLFMSVLVWVVYPFMEKTEVFELYIARDDNGGDVATAGGRTSRWTGYAKEMFEYPLGKVSMYYAGGRYYAHNLWLDVGALAGIIPFTMLLGVTVLSLKRNYTLIYRLSLPSFLIALLIVCNAAFFLSCMVEPMMEGSFTYVLMYLFFMGMTTQLYHQFRMQKE